MNNRHINHIIKRAGEGQTFRRDHPRFGSLSPADAQTVVDALEHNPNPAAAATRTALMDRFGLSAAQAATNGVAHAVPAPAVRVLANNPAEPTIADGFRELWKRVSTPYKEWRFDRSVAKIEAQSAREAARLRGEVGKTGESLMARMWGAIENKLPSRSMPIAKEVSHGGKAGLVIAGGVATVGLGAMLFSAVNKAPVRTMPVQSWAERVQRGTDEIGASRS